MLILSVCPRVCPSVTLLYAYLEELCRPVSDIDDRRHLRSARRGLLDVPRVELSTDVHSATPALPLGTLFLTIWRTALFLCLSSENSLNIFFSHRNSTSSAFEVIYRNALYKLLTYLLTYTYSLTYGGHIDWVTSKVIPRIINIFFSLCIPTIGNLVEGEHPHGGVAVLSWKLSIYLKRGKIVTRLLLITNSKSHACFSFVSKSLTLDDAERSLGLYALSFKNQNARVFGHHEKLNEDRPIYTIGDEDVLYSSTVYRHRTI